MSEYPHRADPAHEHDWNEPPWAVHCTDPYCDMEMTEHLAAKDARIAALEAVVREVADLWGMPIYVRDAQGYESTAHVCDIVTRARALLAKEAPAT